MLGTRESSPALPILPPNSPIVNHLPPFPHPDAPGHPTGPLGQTRDGGNRSTSSTRSASAQTQNDDVVADAEPRMSQRPARRGQGRVERAPARSAGILAAIECGIVATGARSAAGGRRPGASSATRSVGSYSLYQQHCSRAA